MIVVAFALMLAGAPLAVLQQGSAQAPSTGADAKPAPWADPIGDQLARTAVEDMPTSPEGLQAIQRFGACAADASPERAARALRMDFRSNGYRKALKTISDNNRRCFKRGRMRSNSLLFAGALAERLLTTEPLSLNKRLAAAAAKPFEASFGPSDKLATCVVRSMPDEAAAVFATPAGTPEEAKAVGALDVGVRGCAKAVGKQVDISPAGLRAILATAAFRVVDSAKGGAA